MDRIELDILRADEAKRILSSDIFVAAFEDTRAALLNSLAALESMKDPRAAEIHAMVRGLAKVRRCLETHVDTGKLAEREIQAKGGRMFGFLKRA